MASRSGFRTSGSSISLSSYRFQWILVGVGAIGAVAALITTRTNARAAATQNWAPFVLVAGLLLVGMVADDDGLFAAAGHWLARIMGSGLALYVGAMLTVAIVTAVLNLDTSVAFLTPVLVYAARSRGGGEAPLLYGCLMVSNAGSLFLPGSNLTNLIVLGHLHLNGTQFLARMWAPALAGLFVTVALVGIVHRRHLGTVSRESNRPDRKIAGVGLPSIMIASILVLVLHSPAGPVALVGIIAAGLHLAIRRDKLSRAFETVGAPVLVGLFGMAVALGTLGRVWTGPHLALSHLDLWGTAAVAGASAVVVNNLPAASLLAARLPPHPFALLIGLNIGPNLFATGSLAWILWIRAARSAGSSPSIIRASRLGLLIAPISIAASVGVLILRGGN